MASLTKIILVGIFLLFACVLQLHGLRKREPGCNFSVISNVNNGGATHSSREGNTGIVPNTMYTHSHRLSGTPSQTTSSVSRNTPPVRNAPLSRLAGERTAPNSGLPPFVVMNPSIPFMAASTATISGVSRSAQSLLLSEPPLGSQQTLLSNNLEKADPLIPEKENHKTETDYVFHNLPVPSAPVDPTYVSIQNSDSQGRDQSSDVDFTSDDLPIPSAPENTNLHGSIQFTDPLDNDAASDQSTKDGYFSFSSASSDEDIVFPDLSEFYNPSQEELNYMQLLPPNNRRYVDNSISDPMVHRLNQDNHLDREAQQSETRRSSEKAKSPVPAL